MEVVQDEENQDNNIVPITEQASDHPSPPLIGGHIPFSEMGIYPLDDDMVMDISNLTFD